jgi:hypothetical protein
MVFEEVETGTKGVRAFKTQTYPLLALELDLTENDGGFRWEKTMKVPREGHHLNKRD